MYIFIPYWVQVPIKYKMLPNYDTDKDYKKESIM